MLNTIRGWFKPELTDPADIRELNKTLDLQEINMDSMNGYAFAKDILLASDSVEIGKIHINKIPADPDFGKQFSVTAGTLWSNATTELVSIRENKEQIDILFAPIISILGVSTGLENSSAGTATLVKIGKMRLLTLNNITTTSSNPTLGVTIVTFTGTDIPSVEFRGSANAQSNVSKSDDTNAELVIGTNGFLLLAAFDNSDGGFSGSITWFVD